MIRRVIQIDEEKCNGCGLCADSCHEGAIGIIDGKAKLLRDDYCDGLGDCLPACPLGAISFIEREAIPYNETAVLKRMHKKTKAAAQQAQKQTQKVCPSTRCIQETKDSNTGDISQLNNWPCQIKLAPTSAPYFENAQLLIAADCTAYAYVRLHSEFMANKVTLIGCPKLDNIDYSEKLSEIFRQNDIQNITLVRMEVPCCKGLEIAIDKALRASQKEIDFRVFVISTKGERLN